MIRTVLDCSDAGFCVDLKGFLLEQKCFSISAELSIGLDSARRIVAAKPDLVILEMPCSNDFNFVDEFRSLEPQVPVFLFCEQLTMEAERMVLRHKIDAVFAKDEDLSVLVENAKAACGA